MADWRRVLASIDFLCIPSSSRKQWRFCVGRCDYSKFYCLPLLHILRGESTFAWITIPDRKVFDWMRKENNREQIFIENVGQYFLMRKLYIHICYIIFVRYISRSIKTMNNFKLTNNFSKNLRKKFYIVIFINK